MSGLTKTELLVLAEQSKLILTPKLEDFAQRVLKARLKAERERCAQEIDDVFCRTEHPTSVELAEAIRALED